MKTDSIRKTCALVATSLALLAAAEQAAPAKAAPSGKMPDVAEIVLPGEYPGHLQDVWFDGAYLYWAHTGELFKTDREGNVVRRFHPTTAPEEIDAEIAALPGPAAP